LSIPFFWDIILCCCWEIYSLWKWKQSPWPKCCRFICKKIIMANCT